MLQNLNISKFILSVYFTNRDPNLTNLFYYLVILVIFLNPP